MALGDDTFTSATVTAYNAAAGTNGAANLIGLLSGIFATGILLWAGWYVIRTVATGINNNDIKHIFTGLFLAVITSFVGLYIITFIF